MVEQDVIGHLIDVERLASDLMMDAQAEADRRKAEAKEKAERLYLSEYEKTVGTLEASFAESKKKCDVARDDEYAKFARYLDSLKLDKDAFAEYLDKQCFGR
jgi:hypothetical protein